MTPLLGLLPVFFLLKSVLQQEHVGYAHGLANLAHDQQNILFINSSIACSLGIDERVRNETAVPVLPALLII